MKIHRFIGEYDITKKELEITGEVARQIKNVLRLEEGEFIDLSDGKGKTARGKILSIAKDSVMVKIEKTKEDKKSGNDVSLFCTILKKENFELVVQKATECGVNKIIPIISARTIKTGLNIERLQKIAKEASEQSGRSFIPEILEPVSFEKGLEMIKENENNILFDSSGESYFEIHAYSPAGELLCSPRQSAQCISKQDSPSVISKNNSPRINIFIGPEGGWTPEEINKIKEKDFKIASLGTLTLRGETAAIIATYLSVNLQ